MHPPKILVADDDPKLNQLICEALREVGFSPDPAGTAAEARAKIQTCSHDLALIDWMFDGEEIDGRDLIREIAKSWKIPTLMLTGRSALADRVGALDAGADDYLVKPFYLPELLARIRALLRRTQKDSPDRKITVDTLTLDPIAFEAKLGKKLLSLRKKEFIILHFLLENKDRVISRKEIGEKIWGPGQPTNSNLLDVHLKSLREQLGSKRDLIETVRGIGFRIKSQKS